MTTTFIAEQKLALIKHLAGGKPADVVATIMRTSRDAVVEVARHHGYPDVEKLAWAADVLAEKLEESPAGLNTAPLAEKGVPLRDRPTPPRPGERAPLESVRTSDDVMAVLNKAKGHSSKRIQAAADKALDAIAKVRALVADDEKRNAERRKIEKERAEARAEVKRLEQQLAEAKAKLRGGKAAPAPDAAGEFGCDECERTFGSPAGLGIHKGRAHREAAAS